MGTLHILCRRGDDRVTFTKEDYKEAEREFNKLVSDNHAMFDTSVEDGKKLTRFDPTAQSIVAVPRIVGG